MRSILRTLLMSATFVAAGATLAKQGFGDTIADLSVNGTVSGNGSLNVASSPATRTIAFPSLLEVGSVRLVENVELRSVQLPALSSIGGDLDIRDNPQLPSCIAESLAGLVADGGMVTIEGNCADCACD